MCVCVSACVMKGECGERKHLPVCSTLQRGEGLKLRHQSVISSLFCQLSFIRCPVHAP